MTQLSLTRYQLLKNLFSKLDYSVLVVILKFILFRSEGGDMNVYYEMAMNTFKTPVICVDIEPTNQRIHIQPFEFYLYKTISTGTVYRLCTHVFYMNTFIYHEVIGMDSMVTSQTNSQYDIRHNYICEFSSSHGGFRPHIQANYNLRYNSNTIELEFSTLYPNSGPMLLADTIEQCVIAHMHVTNNVPKSKTYQVSIRDFTPTRQLFVPIVS